MGKITSHGGTVRSYADTATKVTVNEVQVVVLNDGINNSPAATFKLSYKGEMSQDMDNGSTEKQVAEEINGFSALSGAVTVAKEGAAKFVVTFDAADGDVAQLVAHGTGTGSAMVVTRENGWSIEGPIGANLDTMQAGGTINITAQEVCTFTLTLSGALAGTERYYFCYDGVCGTTLENPGANDATAAIHSIKDDNGDQILTVTDTFSSPAYAITMPLGKSCDGLEMRA